MINGLPNKQHSILIIDDNVDMLAMLAVILRGRGYNIKAREKLEAIEKEISEIHPNLISIDKNLGWTDGCHLCSKLRAIVFFINTNPMQGLLTSSFLLGSGLK